MAQSLGSLLVDIGASTARLEKDFAKAQKDFSSFGSRVTGMAKGIGLAIGGALTVQAFVGMVKGSIDAADNMGKLSQKVGIAVEELSGYSHAAALSDVSIESLSTALGKLSKNMVETAKGTGSAKDAFSALGISVLNADGSLKSSDVVMGEIADKFAGMNDGAMKTALAMEIFGKAGKDMIPMLNVGSAGLKQMKEESARLGLVINEQTAKAAEQVNDNFTRLNGAMNGAKNQIVFGALPAFENISNMMVDAAGNTKKMELAGAALATGLKLVASVAVGVGAAVETVGSFLGALAGMAVSVATGDFQTAANIWKESNADTSKTAQDAWGTIQKVWDDAAVASAHTATKIKKNQDDINLANKQAEDLAKARLAIQKEMDIDAITSRVDAWVKGEALIEQVRAESSAQAREDLYDAIEIQRTMEVDAISSRVDAWVKGEEEKTKASEKGYAEMQNAVTGWASNFSGTLTDMAFGAKVTFNEILTSFGKMITQMMIQRAVVEPLLGAMGLGTPVKSANGNVFSGGRLQAFANGGIVNKPTLFPMANGAGLMGEAGPEAIMPLKRGRDGRLGVEGGSGGTVVQVMVNNAPAKVREERSNSGGKELVKIFIDAVDEAIGSGRMDKTFNRTFGLQRGGTR